MNFYVEGLSMRKIYIGLISGLLLLLCSGCQNDVLHAPGEPKPDSIFSLFLINQQPWCITVDGKLYSVQNGAFTLEKQFESRYVYWSDFRQAFVYLDENCLMEWGPLCYDDVSIVTPIEFDDATLIYVVEDCALVRSGNLLYSVNLADGNIVALEKSLSKERPFATHENSIYGRSPDGKSIYELNYRTGTASVLQQFTGRESSILSACFANNEFIFVCGDSKVYGVTLGNSTADDVKIKIDLFDAYADYKLNAILWNGTHFVVAGTKANEQISLFRIMISDNGTEVEQILEEPCHYSVPGSILLVSDHERYCYAITTDSKEDMNFGFFKEN